MFTMITTLNSVILQFKKESSSDEKQKSRFNSFLNEYIWRLGIQLTLPETPIVSQNEIPDPDDWAE